MSDAFKQLRDRVLKDMETFGTKVEACGCIGPQNGEPRCPCAMRGVVRRDGRWIQVEVDLGPAALRED